jgi:hypothetical protein
MLNENPVAPPPPRRVTSGQRAEANASSRPERIARIGSGDRATYANGGHSVLPAPPRRRTPTSTTRA